MQQQTQNNTTRQNYDLHSVRVQIAPDSSEMLVESYPFYFFNMMAFFALAFLIALIYFTDDGADRVTGIVCMAVFGGMLIFSVFNKRIIRCWVRKDLGNLSYFRGGVLGFSIDKEQTEFPIGDVTGLVMKRHINLWWRWAGDNFQIAMVIKKRGTVDLTGKDLSFSDCQANTELIINFINPALPIKAED